MPPKIAHYLSKTVLVAIPALFDGRRLPAVHAIGRGAARSVAAIGRTDPATAARRQTRPRAGTPAAVFVPFAQIAGVLVRPPGSAPGSSSRKASPPAAAAREQKPGQDRRRETLAPPRQRQ